MKPMYIISTALLLSVLEVVGCSSSHCDIEGTILKDVTDSLLVQPNSADFFTIAGIDSTTSQSVKITCATISDYRYNPAYSAELSASTLLLSNPWERAKEVKDFEIKVSNSIALLNSEKITRPLSDIYTPLVSEVNRLAAAKANKPFCLLYSDLGQNTASFSIYRNADFMLLKNQPDQVVKFFENIARPDDLKGISIYFVFKPRNARENETFILMSTVLKQIFTSAGAKVYIGANVVANE